MDRALRAADPALCLRRTYPYPRRQRRLMPPLRRRLAPHRYVGIELEVTIASSRRRAGLAALRKTLIETLALP